MIKHIAKFTNKDGKYHFQVFYTSGRQRTFKQNDDLPLSVLEIILNGTCETIYTTTGKVEYFR